MARKFRSNAILADIYPASELPIPGVTGESVAAAVQKIGGKPAHYLSSFAEAAAEIASLAENGDMVLTLGAGNVSHLGPQILEQLRAREKARKMPA